jgi:hypothetical protein
VCACCLLFPALVRSTSHTSSSSFFLPPDFCLARTTTADEKLEAEQGSELSHSFSSFFPHLILTTFRYDPFLRSATSKNLNDKRFHHVNTNTSKIPKIVTRPRTNNQQSSSTFYSLTFNRLRPFNSARLRTFVPSFGFTHQPTSQRSTLGHFRFFHHRIRRATHHSLVFTMRLSTISLFAFGLFGSALAIPAAMPDPFPIPQSCPVPCSDDGKLCCAATQHCAIWGAQCGEGTRGGNSPAQGGQSVWTSIFVITKSNIEVQTITSVYSTQIDPSMTFFPAPTGTATGSGIVRYPTLVSPFD